MSHPLFPYTTDNGPICKEPSYHRTISEGVAIGTHVVKIVTWDADEGPAARSRYSLSGEGNEYFAIDQSNGHVSTARKLDRELIESYDLLVKY